MLVLTVVLALLVGGGFLLAGRDKHQPPVLAVPSTTTAPASPDVRPRPPVSTPSVEASVAPSSESAAPTTSAAPDPLPAETRAIKAVLSRRATALLHRDLAGWTATLDPTATTYRTAQLTMFDNAAAVPFSSYYYDVDAPDVAAATVPSPGRLLVQVTLRYALRGFDPRPTALRDYLTFSTDAGGWLLAGDADGGKGFSSAKDLWDFGPVVVVHGRRSLVLAHPHSLALAHTLAAAADDAVPRVTAFWGTGWARVVVILVPDSEDELRQIVGTTQDLSQIAALATAEIGGQPGSASAVGDRIAINPKTFATLGALGRRVVITHEITHVASRALTGPDSPTWLVEGLADYVGFKGTSTSLRFDATELAHQVDAGRLPTALPASADFARAGATLSLDYEEAWMACRFIVSRTDEATLIAFYRQVGTAKGSPAVALKDAFARVLHTDQATFTTSWVSFLKASLR